ncbi:MAG: DsbE family thiol:disulfide interchange protein [Nevskiaceae bacterium]|nr:MAG: DsbE family thiol:disulfide interchange protein [Nevskiaceae bacterium]TBR73908.1 MAG: DsbE family thiol:disulfide interchange protein [Nevskiaceae bacterium]
MRYRYFIPMIVLVGIVALLAYTLNRGWSTQPEDDPTYVPSPLIGKTVPAFDLAVLATPPAEPPARFTQADLKGRPAVINFFASWCVACRDEHPFLMQLAHGDQVSIIGIDYKDTPQAARRLLGEHGDPYHLILEDPEGAMGLNWGVYGIPETYLVDAHGIVRYKQVGPMTPAAWRKHFQPLLEAAR